MKNILKRLACLVIVLSGLCGCAEKSSLTLGKKVFAPGESIEVHYVVKEPAKENGWVGLLPSEVPHGDESVNDQADLSYKYLSGSVEGKFTFTAPYKPGNYDFRLHDTDGNGRELAFVSFAVEGEDLTGVDSHLKLARSTFKPNEEVVVQFEASPALPRDAWVGIIPSNVAHGDEATNDQHDISYQYLENRASGVLRFAAPLTPGAYDIRMHSTDQNGQELTYVSFQVESTGSDPGTLPVAEKTAAPDAGVSIGLAKTTFKAGEVIQAQFVAKADYADNAWVGIIPSHVRHGDEAYNDSYDIEYKYLNKMTSGTLQFTAPATPGAYDLRMHDTDSNGREVYSTSFTVK